MRWPEVDERLDAAMCANERGCMRICDRANDLVKSGGEWISSVWIEREASDVLEAGPGLLAQELPAMGRHSGVLLDALARLAAHEFVSEVTRC